LANQIIVTTFGRTKIQLTSMKRLLLLTALMMTIMTAAANAQPRSIGMRLGYGAQELSYQHYLGNQYLQADLGTANFKDIQLHATYNWIIANPGWTTQGQWYFFGGAGIGGGYFSASDVEAYGFVGIAGQIGLEYQFIFPLSLSVDFRPVLGPKFGNGGGLYDQWRYMFIPCISVRYLF